VSDSAVKASAEALRAWRERYAMPCACTPIELRVDNGLRCASCDRLVKVIREAR
jgi:hypothetical protein